MDFYSTFIVVHSKHSGIDHLETTPYLTLPNKRSPDSATTDCGGGHLIAAYYSFINLRRMKGRVGQVGCPTADGLPT